MNPRSAQREGRTNHTTKPSAVELYILWAQRELVVRGGKARLEGLD